jgi:hypothetical protein
MEIFFYITEQTETIALHPGEKKTVGSRFFLLLSGVTSFRRNLLRRYVDQNPVLIKAIYTNLCRVETYCTSFQVYDVQKILKRKIT